MTRVLRFAAIALLVLAGLQGCSNDVSETGGGGALLVVTDFDGLPLAASVNGIVATGGFLQVEEFNLENRAKNNSVTVSPLMDVELSRVQVTYQRVDSGSRTPPTYVASIFGIVPIEGSFSIENLPVMGSAQVTNPPLSDLLLENGAFDKETGLDTIILNLTVQFFGRTVAGEELATNPVSFQVEFRP